jgi:hypothetical protein
VDHSICEPLLPGAGFFDLLEFDNRATVEHWRGDELLRKEEFKNGVTNVGKNAFLDAFFNGGTQPANWYLGLINDAGFVTVSSSDTAASHTNWAEWTATSDSGRLDWGQGAASGQQVASGSVIITTLTSAGTLQGIFLISDGTKGGTTGILWATALFSSPLVAEVGDTLKLTYAVQL